MMTFLEGLRYSTLTGYTWEWPRVLLLLPLVPLLFGVRWLLAYRNRRRLGVAFVAGRLRTDWSAVLRFLPDVVLALSLMFGLLALARPQRTDERVAQTGEGIDILLVLDVSGSMELQDLQPNRLEAAKRVAREFVDGRTGDRIGLVAFAGDAYSLAPLTTDYDLLRENLNELRLGMIANDGTAIGTALGVATNRMRDSPSSTKVCILLSDGENTAGNLDPLLAAQLAHAYGLRLYTIGLGQDGTIPFGTDEFGRPRYVETRLDESTMRQLATAGGGQFFRATDTKALRQIFRQIDRLEKSEIRQTRFRNTRDYYRYYLYWCVGLWMLWLGLKNTFLTNSMED
ncbi:von Willebrand factor A [Hymenobacter sp. DG25B]|jgi:Ca-activated chloride channel family protein|uniref:vWA domain-containing protein n=1 Tax=Hymenobacter sp. DG25B TaxID=1385664 RepID=UPI000540E890|nr:VWA domain-containing protein [Hymenobacter sp. DG25B]AIZ64266.1 von Willebrand factor A [Hymenobacter sp. DG25B]